MIDWNAFPIHSFLLKEHSMRLIDIQIHTHTHTCTFLKHRVSKQEFIFEAFQSEIQLKFVVLIVEISIRCQ